MQFFAALALAATATAAAVSGGCKITPYTDADCKGTAGPSQSVAANGVACVTTEGFLSWGIDAKCKGVDYIEYEGEGCSAGTDKVIGQGATSALCSNFSAGTAPGSIIVKPVQS